MPNYLPSQGPSVIQSVAVTTTTQLLRVPFVFSQSPLLDESHFRKEARRRGVQIDRSELELLHRRRVIVPLFRVTKGVVSEPVDIPVTDGSRVPSVAHLAAAAGRLQDPAIVPFRAWPKRWGDGGVYYSRFQMLMLRALPYVFSRMRYSRDGHEIVCELGPLDRRSAAAFEHDRRLAIALEVLAPRYLPHIVHVYRSPSDEYHALVDDRDPSLEHRFLGLDSKLMLKQAELLLSTARGFDPLGEWHRVSRIANRTKWDGLAFDALLAQEHRLAAEMLLLHLEDEAAQGRSDPLPELAGSFRLPRHDRVLVDQRERAETIMDFRLSDRPAVILALEGQTEITTAQRVLDLFGYEEFSPLISLIDLDGVNGDVRLLARATAVPLLDPDGHRGARVLAPLSALVVAADPEGRRFSTAEAREKTRRSMRQEVLNCLPKALRTESMRDDLDYLLFVRTWPAEFEFAHFTNTELARAIKSVTPGAPPEREIRRSLSSCRQNGGPIRSVWANWAHRPSKIAMAEALWPALEGRIRGGRQRVPIVELLREVLQIASNARRAREMAPQDRPHAREPVHTAR